MRLVRSSFLTLALSCLPGLPPGAAASTAPIGIKTPGIADSIPGVALPYVHLIRTTTLPNTAQPNEFEVMGDTVPPPPTPNPVSFLSFRVLAKPNASPRTGPICPTDSIHVEVTGSFPNGCYDFHGIELMYGFAGPPPLVRITMEQAQVCVQVPTRRMTAVTLAPLPPGSYVLPIQLVVVQVGTNHDSVYSTRVPFRVDSCNGPPPGPGPLPYVDEIRIQPKPDLLPVVRPLCPTDSILVSVRGTFPDDCFEFKEIQILKIASSLAPGPPIVRIIVDDHRCLRRFCNPVRVPWSAHVLLPALPAGRHGLITQLGQVTCSDSIPPDRLYLTVVPFQVDSCTGPLPPRPQTCVIGVWPRPDLQPPGTPHRLAGCNATIAPGRAAELVFALHSGVPLSALQGEFHLEPRGLAITGIEPIGPATGMHLTWTRTPRGARFVLFAERGAPIPPSPWPALDPRPPVPVLKLTVRQASSAPTAPVTVLTNRALLGSDAEGHGVPMCSQEILFAARICLQLECDFNHDARTDVRDLVLMVRCLNRDGPCPDSARLDCNHDGDFTLEDVMCCARRILGGVPCPDCPRDTSITRREPTVRLGFASPRDDPGGVIVPLRLHGADRLGAARLTLTYPSDRFDVAGIEILGTAPGWLLLHEARDENVVIGLIRTGGQAADDDEEALDVLLRLALKPGREAGGDVTAVEGDFSGPDGVRLEVELGRPTQGLGGPTRIALSANRPNPFATGTRFALMLDRPAEVEVAIYDVGGRRVVILHDGRLAAGTHEFQWNGAFAEGSAATSGIYFARAVSGGTAVARKMILLRRN